MKHQRHNAIRDLLAKAAAGNGSAAISNQDELRRKLAARGIHVTQATLVARYSRAEAAEGACGL